MSNVLSLQSVGKWPLQLAAEPVQAVKISRNNRRQIWRRTVIRARTRRLIAEYGIDGVRIRDLADSCGIAIQTLYNNFGGRDEILAASIGELLDVQFSRAKKEAVLAGCNPILAICDLTARLWVEDERYIRAIVDALVCQKTDTARMVEKKCLDVYLDILNDLKAEDLLKSWVDVDLMTVAINDAIKTAFSKCISSGLRDADLRLNLLMPVGAYLVGITEKSTSQTIESSLDKLCLGSSSS